MRQSRTTHHLYDPRKGAESIRLEDLTPRSKTIEPPRTNYFSIYWIESGEGEFWADAGRHPFEASSLLFFTPYQYIRIARTAAVGGVVVQFHANFLCVETFHAESGCAGALDRKSTRLNSSHRQ